MSKVKFLQLDENNKNSLTSLQEISPRAAASLDSLALHKPLRAVASLLEDDTAVAPHMLQAWRQGEREALERSLDSDSILPELQQVSQPFSQQ